MEKVFTNLTTGGPISVYVEDGKITRVRPLQVPEEDYPKPWTVEDRNGKKYSPPKAMRVAQNILAEKNRLYSEDRILYPMKRVDWDPDGERNPQNRGISGYERISWDEAASIIAKEIDRLAPRDENGVFDGEQAFTYNKKDKTIVININDEDITRMFGTSTLTFTQQK